ncbi:MAG: hypothetical protein ICV73_11390 [Acetobacteraceae bacterium]|nr:hypothetical protein [Acetobacteraceae bacterium]
MVTGDGAALVLVRHPGIPREEVAEVLRWRWPNLTVSDVGAVSPSWAMSIEDAAELAGTRRGIEPLRIVILAQRAADASAGQRTARYVPPPPVEPMPVAFEWSGR